MVITLDYRDIYRETLVKVFISARADFIWKKVIIYLVCNVVASYFKWGEKMTRPGRLRNDIFSFTYLSVKLISSKYLNNE